MRGPEKQAIVVRAPEGLVTKVEELKLVRDKYPILGLPIIRGVVTFLDSMVKGIKALMFSADYFPDDEAAQPSKFDLWLEKHVPAEKFQSILVTGFPAAVPGTVPGSVHAAAHVCGGAVSRAERSWSIILSRAPSRY